MTKSEILLRELGLKQLFRLRTWHKAVLPYVRGFYVSRCLEALEICGCLDVLRSQEALNLNVFLGDPRVKRYDKKAIESVCDYLYTVGIFTKHLDSYGLTKIGERICLYRHGYFHFMQAYGPIFYELPQILMGEKKYGVDLTRKDLFVAKATAEVSEWLPLPAVRRLIQKYSFQRVLDLGCGRGELLLSLASKINTTSLSGVDIAVESVSEGLQRIKDAGLSHRISLKVADINKPELFQDWLKISDVVTIMFVLHELLNKGEDFLVDFLKNLKMRTRQDAYFLIAETPRQNPENVRKRPTSIAEHHLFHMLSHQGILEANQLRAIVRRAGFKIVEDLYFATFSQHYILAQ